MPGGGGGGGGHLNNSVLYGSQSIKACSDHKEPYGK